MKSNINRKEITNFLRNLLAKEKLSENEVKQIIEKEVKNF